MRISSLKRLMTVPLLLGALVSHSAFALLINSPAEMAGTEGMPVSSFKNANASVSVGYVRRWSEHICESCYLVATCCHDEYHSSNEIQSSSVKYKWDFGSESDCSADTGTVLTSNGYFNDGKDNLLVSIPAPKSNIPTYGKAGIYNSSLVVTTNDEQQDSRDITVMVAPNELLSSNVDVCDINNATAISSSTSMLWTKKKWKTPTGGYKTLESSDIVFIKDGHEVVLPDGNTHLEVAGLCVDKSATLTHNATGNNYTMISAAVIHNKGTIESAAGSDGYSGTATSGSIISLAAGRIINDGVIKQGKGGNDDIAEVADKEGIEFSKPEQLWNGETPLATEARGRDGGHTGIFSTDFTNNGTISAGTGGIADVFINWAKFHFGNAYAGRGGSVHISSKLGNQITGINSGNVVAGCGGYAEAVGTQIQKVVAKPDSWIDGFLTGIRSITVTQADKLSDVAGGAGGSISVNLSHLGSLIQGCEGQTNNHAVELPVMAEVIRFEPTLLEVDETTRLVNANHIVIVAGDDAEVDLRKLAPNAVQAYKTITLSVGQNSTIDLRGVTSKVFQAAEKVEVFADNILLDEGVTLEDLVDAPELSVNPSKILYAVDVMYDSQAKGAAGSLLSIPLTLLNNGPTEDTYTIEAKDSLGWLLSPYPTEISAGGLRRSGLSLELQLPKSGNEESELTVTVTSQSDPSVKQEVVIRASVQYPEQITPRDGRQAEVAMLLDIGYRHSKKLHDIADTLVKLMKDKGPISPSDNQMKAWFEQFDDDNPPTKEAYVEFISGFQPKNPPPLPIIELITFEQAVLTRVVTDNLGDVVGRIRAFKTLEDDTCNLTSVEAIEHSLTNVKVGGQMFLAVDSAPTKDMSAVIQQLQQKKVKVHVLFSHGCDEENPEIMSIYQNLAGATGGIFRVMTGDEATDAAALEALLDMILSTGKYTVMGTITNEAGEPIEGVTLEINAQTTTTDAAGNWEIPNFMEGEYTLTAIKEGYVFAPQVVELGNEIYHQQVELKPLSSLTLVAIPSTFEDIPQGEDLTYTFTILNGGAQTATGVTLTEMLPAGVTVVSFEALYGGSCDAETLVCQLPDLNTGASATVQLTLHNEGNQSLKNTATLTSNEYPEDIQTSFKKVKPYLSVAITDTPDPVVMESGLHVQAQIELSPLAPQLTATGVKLFLQLPEGTELKDVNTEHGICNIGDYPTVICDLDDLSIATPDSISRIVVDINVTLTDATLLMLTQEARVSADNYPAHSIREHTKVVVPSDAMANITLVMDTTQSMNEELNGTIKALQSFVVIQAKATVKPIISVIEFKDNVTLQAFTTDEQQVLDIIQHFVVEGGGLCQEASAEALDLAIDHTLPGGIIVLITDASPYEGSDMAALAKRLRDKQVNLTVLISGDCTTSSGQTSWNNI